MLDQFSPKYKFAIIKEQNQDYGGMNSDIIKATKVYQLRLKASSYKYPSRLRKTLFYNVGISDITIKPRLYAIQSIQI